MELRGFISFLRKVLFDSCFMKEDTNKGQEKFWVLMASVKLLQTPPSSRAAPGLNCEDFSFLSQLVHAPP